MRYVLLLVLLSCGLVVAQEETSTEVGVSVQTGMATSGRIDDRNPRQVYSFEGSRGEVVRVSVTVTDGNLDAVLTVFDAQGNVLLAQDDASTQEGLRATLSLQQDTRYYLVVGRFGYNVGTTAGDYDITLERVGVVSKQGSTLLFGVPVTDTISNGQPQVYYTFRANEGDIVTIEMQRTSGNLDPYLQILDRNRFVVANNDDVETGDSHNARVDNFIVEQTGVYIVVASRYGEVSGESVGNFILSVYEGQFSGLGNSTLAPEEILYNQPTTGTLNTDQFQRFYRFSARENDVLDVSVVRSSGSLDTFVMLQDLNGNTLFEDDDSGGGKNALIEGFRVPSDGQYVAVVMRYGAKGGDTQGDYRLQIDLTGSAFENVNEGIPRLLYGTTVPDNINDADADSIYAFWGVKDEIITITMSRLDGDLDAVLVLLDEEQNRLVSDDDSGGNGNAAINRYKLPYSGVYYINARRFEGASGNQNTAGNFAAVLVKVGVEEQLD